MIDLPLDENIVENYKTIIELQRMGFTDKEIQKMIDKDIIEE